jgi:hypothetical protein
MVRYILDVSIHSCLSISFNVVYVVFDVASFD